MKKQNSNVILNCQYRLVNNYLAKGLFIIEKESKQLSILPNDAKLKIYVIDQLEIYFVMAKNIAISSVENTKILHIQKNIHSLYQQDLYEDKQKEIDNLFIEYIFPIMGNLDHPALIKELKQNIDADAYEEKINQDVKLPSKKKIIDRYDKTEYCPTSIKEGLNWFPFFDIM